MEEEKLYEHLSYQTMDLLTDAMKWKDISDAAENDNIRMIAKENLMALVNQYKRSNEVLIAHLQA